VNAELNASDAFVAAWLPGSEGGGVADVLIGDQSGKPRHDFNGKLSFSWPKQASQTGLRAMRTSAKTYDPLFPLGFGLTYADHETLAALDEHNDVGDVGPKYGKFLVAGRAQAPWTFTARGDDAISASSANGALGIDWTGKGSGIATLEGAPVSLLGESNFRMAYAIRYRVEQPPSAQVTLEMRCGADCRSGVLDFTPFLKSAKVGEWQEVHVRLTCFRESGIDISRVTNPLAIKTSGSLRLSLSDIHLVPEPDMKTCPQDLHGEE
jgi:beta-glucosidase